MALRLIDTSIMPYGKHKGKHMHQVPDSYLYWLHEQMLLQGTQYGNSKLVFDYITDNLDSLNA